LERDFIAYSGSLIGSDRVSVCVFRCAIVLCTGHFLRRKLAFRRCSLRNFHNATLMRLFLNTQKVLHREQSIQTCMATKESPFEATEGDVSRGVESTIAERSHFPSPVSRDTFAYCFSQ
jgi:hypothetical protein